jgi:hypothetical protein
MKKYLYSAFLVVFLAMGLVLSAGIAASGPSQAGANERLSPAPSLFNDEALNDRFLSDLAAWVNDHFFLRQELISVNNRLNATVFHTSEKDSVILGSDGWLYYGSTLDDYTGQNPMTDRELSAAARNLELMAQYCKENGKQFTFMICPNKNSLYADHMPNFGTVSTERNAQKLLTMLQNVNCVDLFRAFANEDEILYFQTDSHWNSRGAALGADLINASFGKESHYFDGKFHISADYTGDLFEMLYPAFEGNEIQPVYADALDFSFSGRATRPDSITLQTSSESDGALLAYRDSFGNLLFPYLADSYGTAYFSRSTSYDLTKEADFVLVELVERNLRYLITNIPVMPSPIASITPAEDTISSTTVQHDQRANAPEGLSLWTGQIEFCAGDRIYVLCNGDYYEAFQTTDGFAVYLPNPPESIVVQGNYAGITYTVSQN